MPCGDLPEEPPTLDPIALLLLLDDSTTSLSEGKLLVKLLF
jgi:hypothetical protein